MDVSDIEDDDHMPPQGSRVPQQHRGPGQGAPPQRPGVPPGPQPNFQPSPPPKYAPRPPNASTGFGLQHMNPYRRSADAMEDGPGLDMQPAPPMRASNPLPGAQRGLSNYYNRSPSPNPAESFPPSNRPRPAPRPPRMQPAPPKAQARNTPSPVNRPGSGSNLRDLTSPPSGDQSGRESRPDSGSRPPGMLEGKKILPPPMLMPLENAPRPNLNRDDKPPKKKKKKRRDRGNTLSEGGIDRDLDVRSPPEPPENLTPPRGFAAPLHPPPSATTRPPRAQSGIPSPKYSKGSPQKHDNRYVEENMEEEKEDSASQPDKPPMVNGMAVPIREAPMRSARPGKRLQPMDTSDEFEMNGIVENGDTDMQENVINEDEEVGPLIPPPQGFRGPSARPNQGRPLSQSIPQDSRSNAVRTNSAKPPLPRGRGSPSSSTANFRYKHPSPPRRPARPPTTGRNET